MSSTQMNSALPRILLTHSLCETKESLFIRFNQFRKFIIIICLICREFIANVANVDTQYAATIRTVTRGVYFVLKYSE